MLPALFVSGGYKRAGPHGPARRRITIAQSPLAQSHRVYPVAMNFTIKIMPPSAGRVAIVYNNDAEPIGRLTDDTTMSSGGRRSYMDGRDYRFSVTVQGDHGSIQNPGRSAEIERSDGVRHAVTIDPDEFSELPNGKELHVICPDKTTVAFMLGK